MMGLLLNLNRVADLTRTIAALVGGVGLTLMAIVSAVMAVVTGNRDWFSGLIFLPFGFVFLVVVAGAKTVDQNHDSSKRN